MPLSKEDHLEILRHIQTTLQRLEPDLFESLSQVSQIDAPPHQIVLRYLSSLINAYRQRSAGTYPRVLSLLNQYIKPSEGERIEGIKIALSPQEQELYRMKEVNLSEMPERDELIAELRRIYDVIESEPPGERGSLR